MSGCIRRRHYSLVLGLESSCDDTCASVVTSDRRILSNVVIRSDLNRQYQGIHPIAAVHGHEETMARSVLPPRRPCVF